MGDLNVCLATELQNYVQRKGPEPRYEIDLCFGEEYPDPNVPKTQKLITVHVMKTSHPLHSFTI